MTEKNFKSFEQFYEEVKPKRIKIDDRNKSDIINEILKIDKSFNERS